MFCCLEGTFLIGHNNGITSPSYWTTVETNYRWHARRVGRQRRSQITPCRRDNEKTCGTIGPELAEVERFLCGIIVGIAENYAVRVLECDIFGAPDNARKERICNVGNNHSQHSGPIRAQALRDGAWLKTQAPN